MTSLNTNFCPQCGNSVDSDSRFCKHCGSSLVKNIPAPLPPEASLPTKRPSHMLWIGGASILGLLCITVITVFLFRSRQPKVQASTTESSVTAAATTLTISDKAQQIEAKILRDEYLSNGDITGLSAYELRVLRNVHFARYGRKYDQPELRDYFLTRPWYKPSDSYSNSMITETDKANINVIKMTEDALKQSEEITATATPMPTPPPVSSSSCSGGTLTTDCAQMALNKFFKRGSGRIIGGIREITSENTGVAELDIRDFIYTRKGDTREFIYSGKGKAVFAHYTDGRWVLNKVVIGDMFDNVTWSPNIEVQ
jgi:hypothetical protein